MKKSINVILSTISILIFIASIYIMVGSSLAIKNNELFRVFGYSFAVVPTSSMEGSNTDSFNAGSAVLAYNTPYTDLEVGDIVIYKSESNKLIIHRIVEKVKDGFLVKGDNNEFIDSEVVTHINYQAKYTYHFDFFNIGIWLKDYRNILLLVFGSILLITIVYQVIHIIVSIQKQKLIKFEEDLKKEEKKDDEGIN